MPKRRFPVLVVTRVTPQERALIAAAAELDGVTVTELVRRMLLPQVAARVGAEAETLAEPAPVTA